MVFLVTARKPHIEAEGGRIVGMMEFRNEIGRIEQYFPEKTLRDLAEDSNGFRWRWAVPASRAWRFRKPYPRTRAILGKVPMSAIQYPWELSTEQADKILRLPHDYEPVGQPQPATIRDRRRARRARALRGGPPPGTYEYHVIKDHQGPCFVYLLRFGERDIWKVGISINTDRRLNEINAHVPGEVLEEKWRLERRCEFPDPSEAYQVEQQLLAYFEDRRTEGERVLAPLPVIAKGWHSIMSAHDAG